MKLKIISNGKPNGTKIVDEAGRALEGVVAVRWSISTGELSRIVLDLVDIPVEISEQVVTLVGVESQKGKKRLIRLVGPSE